MYKNRNIIGKQAAFITTCFLGLAAFVIAQPSIAEGKKLVTLEKIKQIELSRIDAEVASQVKIDSLDDERLSLSGQYRLTLKQISNLKKYNQQLINTIESQSQEKEVLQQQISRISTLERDIVPLMADMLDALSEFIHLDTPFLYAERLARVNSLRDLLKNGNVSNSEKYRRILEAYQIENDYGRSIEAYDGEVASGSNKLLVTFLKVGRLAYLYQTKDKEKVFHWSLKDHSWKQLESSYLESVDEGIKMAREQIPSNLMFIPVDVPFSI